MMMSCRERKKANKMYCNDYDYDDDNDSIDDINNNNSTTQRDVESILFDDKVGGAAMTISDHHHDHDVLHHNIGGGHISSSCSDATDSEAKLKFIFRALFDKCVNEYNQARGDNNNNNHSHSSSDFSASYNKSGSNNNYNISELLSTTTHHHHHHQHRLPGLDKKTKSHIVACADVIDYFHRDIIHNMSENHKNEGIEQLRQLFLEHFRGQNKGDNNNNNLAVGSEQELLQHFKLDFQVFNEILTKWINQLNTTTSHQNNHQNEKNNKPNKSTFYHPYYKKRANQVSAAASKQHHNKRDITSALSGSNSPSSSISSSSSIPSISDDDSSSFNRNSSKGGGHHHRGSQINNDDDFVEIKIEKKDSTHTTSSDEEVEEKLIIIDNNQQAATEIKIHTSLNNSTDEEEDFYYDENSNSNSSGYKEFAFKLDELKSENIKLRQSQLDMKLQLQNAEVMNEQLVADLEAQTSNLAELNKSKRELTTRVNLLNDENEYLKRQLKKNSDELAAENETLSVKLRDTVAKLEWNENEIATLSAHSLQDKSEIERLVAEVNRHRTISRDTYNLNSDLEQQIIESNIKLCEKNHEIEKLRDTLREYRSENDGLSEKLQKLQSDLFILNSQLLENKLAELNKKSSQLDQQVVADTTNGASSQVKEVGSSSSSPASRRRLNENSFFLEQLEQQLGNRQLNHHHHHQHHSSSDDQSRNKLIDCLSDDAFETKSESQSNRLIESLLVENSKLKDQLEQSAAAAASLNQQHQQKQHLADRAIEPELISTEQTSSSSSSKSLSIVESTNRENDDEKLDSSLISEQQQPHVDSQSQSTTTVQSKSDSTTEGGGGRRPSYKDALVKNMKEMDYNFDYLYNNESLLTKRESFNANEILEIRPGSLSSSRAMSQECQETTGAMTPLSPRRLVGGNGSSKLATCYTIKSSFEPFVQPSLMASAALTTSNTESSVVRRKSSSRESCGFLLNSKRNSVKKADSVNSTVSTSSSSKRFQHQINILTHGTTFDSSSSSIASPAAADRKQQQHLLLKEHDAHSSSLEHHHSLKSQSLPSLIGENSSDKTRQHVKTVEMSTQTDEFSSSSSSSTSSTCSINNETTTTTTTNGLIKAKLRHQLTRDSGIDSDHAAFHGNKKKLCNNNNKLTTGESTEENADKSSSSGSNSLTRPSSLPLRSKFDRHDYVAAGSSSIDYPNEKLELDSNQHNADLMSDLVKKRHDFSGKSEVASRRLLFKNSSRKTVGFNGLSTSVDRPETGTSSNSSSNDKQPGGSSTSGMMSLDDQLNDSLNSNEELDTYSRHKQALESSSEPVVSHTLLAKLSEELASSSCSPDSVVQDENKLKQLESDFEQISLSYQSDKSLVRECMDSYKEKFQRLDASSASLFDEMSSVLNQLVHVVNELPIAANQTTTKTHLTVPYQQQAIESSSSTSPAAAAFKISSKSRKSMQDDLNKLNYTVKLLKKNMFNLISTTCLLSALKQEAQMSNLIKIAISYVHMLKRSTEATTMMRPMSRVQNGSFDFYLPNEETTVRGVKDNSQKSNIKLTRALTMNQALEAPGGSSSRKSGGRKLGKRNKSINKTNFETTTPTSPKSVVFSDKIETSSSMGTRSPAATRSLWLASMSFIRSISGGSTQQDDLTDILEKSDLLSSSSTSERKKSVETDSSSSSGDASETDSKTNQIVGKKIISPSATTTSAHNSMIKYHLNRLPSFIRGSGEDSFSFRQLRVTASVLLFATSLLVFLIALFNDQDIFKVIFDLVFARKKQVALRMKN